jgi:putative oxidoreductase
VLDVGRWTLGVDSKMEETLATSPHRNPLPKGEGDHKSPRIAASGYLYGILALLVAAVFVYAGILKILDPVGFARDVDNYKLLPWPAAVALGFFLPWLEIFCGIALITRRLYRGGLVILSALTAVFIAASIIAKARGLDISCGCFGHASKGWSFGWHLLLDFGLLAALMALLFAERRRSTRHSEHYNDITPKLSVGR